MTAPPRSLPEAEIADLAELGRSRPSDELMAAVDAAAQRALGHRMLTVMRLHLEPMELERVYSSRADAYPPGGRKPKRGLAWSERVLVRGEVFMGSGANDMAWAFEDHAKLAALGLTAILNTPILVAGRCLGTLNLLHEAGWYRPGDDRITRLLAWLVAPALMATA